jgi:hypothetical protein
MKCTWGLPPPVKLGRRNRTIMCRCDVKPNQTSKQTNLSRYRTFLGCHICFVPCQNHYDLRICLLLQFFYPTYSFLKSFLENKKANIFTSTFSFYFTGLNLLHE